MPLQLVRFVMRLASETVTVDLKNGTVITGTVTGVDAAMNVHMKSCRVSVKGGAFSPLDSMTVRGAQVRTIHLPETLNLDNLLTDTTARARPNLKRLERKKQGGGGGRGRGRGRGRGDGGRG